MRGLVPGTSVIGPAVSAEFRDRRLHAGRSSARRSRDPGHPSAPPSPLRVIPFGNMIAHLRIISHGLKAVRKARGDIQRRPVVSAEFDADPTAARWRARPQVDRYVEDGPAGTGNKLGPLVVVDKL